MLRVACFSPLPPSASGIAAYSAELLPLLVGDELAVDVYTAENAHAFVWRHRRQPYDLTVFQLGNADCHDYMWGYQFRYPGVVVLHDVQLHQARALHLTRQWPPRRADYFAEFAANHPDAPAAIARLVAAGHGGTLYPYYPLLRLVAGRARLVAVHNGHAAAEVARHVPGVDVRIIPMGVADPLAALPTASDRRQARERVLARHSLPTDALVVAALGGLTPEKRLPQLLRAASRALPQHPRLHVLLVGKEAAHYDVGADLARWGLAQRVSRTGFVTDEELPSYLLAADVCACLRWPTNQETSASWLRCLAAGRTTLVSDLAALTEVPTFDPRSWQVLDSIAPKRSAVAVSIDLLDEDHSLHLALDRLLGDAALRAGIGDAARAWWTAHHQLGAMATAYREMLTVAAARPTPTLALPRHLNDHGTTRLQELTGALGVTDRLSAFYAT